MWSLALRVPSSRDPFLPSCLNQLFQVTMIGGGGRNTGFPGKDSRKS